MCGKPTIPSSRGLLQPIQGLVETTNEVRMGKILKTKRRHIVYCLSKHSMQEGILDIKMMDRPPTRESQREDCPNSGRLHHRAEGLQEIHAGSLRETAENPAHLVLLKRSIRLELVLEDTLPSDYVDPCRVRHKIPGVILQESIMFFYHSSAPMGSARALR